MMKFSDNSFGSLVLNCSYFVTDVTKAAAQSKLCPFLSNSRSLSMTNFCVTEKVLKKVVKFSENGRYI